MATAEAALYHALADFRPAGPARQCDDEAGAPGRRTWARDLFRRLPPEARRCRGHGADGSRQRRARRSQDARPAAMPHPQLLPRACRACGSAWIRIAANSRTKHRDGICGKMYSQPRERCECGARVLELYTCRNCGTAYARAYTDDVDAPSALWSEPGSRLRMAGGETSPLLPLDLLLEEPALGRCRRTGGLRSRDRPPQSSEPGSADAHVSCPQRPHLPSGRRRRRTSTDDFDGARTVHTRAPCAARPPASAAPTCRITRRRATSRSRRSSRGRSRSSRRVPCRPRRFAPLQGRKVLVFSDSRQVAARLAPNLQMYSVRDSLRPLIAWGYRQPSGASAAVGRTSTLRISISRSCSRRRSSACACGRK